MLRSVAQFLESIKNHASAPVLRKRLALYGAPADRVEYPLNLRMVLRSNVAPLYRSDVTWLERLHHELATDVLPEDLGERAGDRFRR